MLPVSTTRRSACKIQPWRCSASMASYTERDRMPLQELQRTTGSVRSVVLTWSPGSMPGSTSPRSSRTWVM
jgi:hypothetical protein